MKQLDTSILDDAGLTSLTDDQKDTILAFAMKTLQTRVGIRLAEQATKEQLEAFEKFTDNEAAMNWLETAFPDFNKIVDEELAEIKAELAEMAFDILKAE